jgi:diamine N-acetyltransferase
MIKLVNETVSLRAVDPEDLDFVYALENDPGLWHMGNTYAPYSKFTIREYLENAHRDIYEVKQLRLAICNPYGAIVGVVDLYDFDPMHRRAGVGIAIANTADRTKGYASAALELVVFYAFDHLMLHQLYACIAANNSASKRLFQKLRFRESGIKTDWIATKKGYVNEHFYQLINEQL